MQQQMHHCEGNANHHECPVRHSSQSIKARLSSDHDKCINSQLKVTTNFDSSNLHLLCYDMKAMQDKKEPAVL